MKIAATLAFTLLPLASWAQINAVADLEIPNPPIRSQSVFNGQMLGAETEFLTPDGILETLPAPQQAYVPVEDIEPAAGFEQPPVTEPAAIQELPEDGVSPL
ncbi:MAG: hypothetical protein EON60_08940 [Alphaproteobacteria bacterium]|nr:MAG: hypothetical protein EON60_08940 [Alphaproteobacteria bacterium]